MTKEQLKEKIDEAQALMVRLLPGEEYGENYDAERLWNIIEELGQVYDNEICPSPTCKSKNITHTEQYSYCRDCRRMFNGKPAADNYPYSKDVKK